MKRWVLLILLGIGQELGAQTGRDQLYSGFVLQAKRDLLAQDLRERTVGRTFALTPDSDNEDRFESACLAVTQFQLRSEESRQGLQKLFDHYDSLGYDTRWALLEATFAVYPETFIKEVQRVVQTETHPKLFAISVVYLYRQDTSIDHTNSLKIRMVEQFPGYDTLPLLLELEKWLNRYTLYQKIKTPALPELFAYNKLAGQKMIYSFQRWDRDQPGMAIVQQADGRFARHPDGRLMVFEQLARSASALPYFLTNGNTPQGVYRVTGIGVSRNNFIGPTPNIQLQLPYEGKWGNYFQLTPGSRWDSTRAALDAYQLLLPPRWRNYGPMQEALYAGKIGRREIIAHGTTLDPEYFKDKPYYPLTPSMGCLCARELWNGSTGRLLVSEQWNLYSAFTATPGSKGYLMVLNVDHEDRPVSRADVERWVAEYEKKK
ncbi:MAG: hypothetical protein P0Y53_24815 [Candidatus Pseudobacter hemicellulosilyticus]|uniref:Uncharacterized protein n=1 Tax=Candidatus Pseudobacter hemicellulosilyticus TaxID=3121375 RepID=A0AAJ6BHY7_9BACT|nr:MAG: hypothetical protein P0Y53_24815 [Pseudobacter sp.]